VMNVLLTFDVEIRWQYWKFSACPKMYWDSMANRRYCMDWVAEQLGIQTQEDWYSVSGEDFVRYSLTP
jgi:hypothetical protein